MKSRTIPHMIGKLLNGLVEVSPRWTAALTFTLFGMPRRKTPKAVEAAFLATADMHYIHIDGTRIAVYHWGFRGPIVLLAHGWESHAGRWRKIAPPLVQAGYQVLAVDAPAHGRSGGRHFTMVRYAEVLRVLAQRFGPIDTMIGHSVGGASTIWAMSQLKPEQRPRKSVILAAFSAMQTVLDGARRTIGAGDKLVEAFDAHVQRVTGAPIAHYSLTRVAEQLGEVDTLLVHDRLDKVTPFRESERLHAAWPGSHLLVTEGYHHGLTAPEVTDAILEFVLEDVFIR